MTKVMIRIIEGFENNSQKQPSGDILRKSVLKICSKSTVAEQLF